MRGLVWILGVLVLGASLLLADPPYWMREPAVVLVRAEANRPSQSQVARLAEAGAPGRRQVGPSLVTTGPTPVTVVRDPQ